MFNECWYCGRSQAKKKYAHPIKLATHHWFDNSIFTSTWNTEFLIVYVPRCRTCSRLMWKLDLAIRISLCLRVATGILAALGIFIAIINTAIPGIEWRVGIILTLSTIHYGAAFFHVRSKEALTLMKAKKIFRSARGYPPVAKVIEQGGVPKRIIF